MEWPIDRPSIGVGPALLMEGYMARLTTHGMTRLIGTSSRSSLAVGMS